MATSNQPLLAQITQNPLLISADAQDLFQQSIQHIVTHEHAQAILGAAQMQTDSEDEFWPKADSWMAQLRPYVVKNGILHIPVMGVLLSRFPYQFGRWATGYKYVEKALERGVEDDNVKGVAFLHDSPGGEVRECFELSDKIFEARGAKPMKAFVADHSYSASFALSSAADEIVITRSGGVGSVGVVTAHVDFSEAMKDMGIKVTFIFAGDHKVDGNPFEKLPDSVKARIQKRIDKIYGVFTSTVARNRSMDEQAVIDTKALTYDADESLEVSFADRIGALDEEMVIFANEVSEAEDETMADKNNADTVTKAEHDAAVAAAREEGKKEALASASTGERDRINAILNSDEGKARPKAAMTTAMKTDMSVDAAKAFLADLPEEKAAAPDADAKAKAKAEAEAKAKADADKAKNSPFETAMGKDNPEVGADANSGKNDEQDDDAKAAASILADFAGQAGIDTKNKAA